MKRFLINVAIIFGFMALLKIFNSYNALSFIFGAIAECLILALDSKNVKN